MLAYAQVIAVVSVVKRLVCRRLRLNINTGKQLNKARNSRQVSGVNFSVAVELFVISEFVVSCGTSTWSRSFCSLDAESAFFFANFCHLTHRAAQQRCFLSIKRLSFVAATLS